MTLALSAKDVKNSLYVRNLSPNVTEGVLREVFGQVDDIVAVTFRAFPNSNNQFFAQIDFVSSKGVAQGSRLNGTPIMGSACQVGVIDPLAAKMQQDLDAAKHKASKLGLEVKESGQSSIDRLFKEAAESHQKQSQDEYIEQQKKSMEDQSYRTVHMTGFDPGVSNEALKAFCEHFGEVVSCKVEEPESIAPYALVEFKERGPANVVKTQKTYEVDGRIVSFNEAKTMVDASGFAEQSVHFQMPIQDHMAMGQVLATQGNLNAKLAKVREAAMTMQKLGIGKSGSAEDDEEREGADKSAPSMAALDKSLKDKKKKKKEKKDEKDEKKDKKVKKRRKEASKSRSVSKPRNDAREKAFTKEFLQEHKRKRDKEEATSEQESPKKKKKKKKKEKEESDDKDDSPKKKKLKKKEETPQKKKPAKPKQKKTKMALDMEEDDEAPELEEKVAPEKKTTEDEEAAQKEESDDESSSAPIDLDDPDEVDFVYGAEKVALSSASSSSSSSSKSSIKPGELEITGVDHGLEMTATDIALEFIAQTKPVDLSDDTKTLPLGSPAMTTPGDISSTDSSSDSSDSPVREVAGEVSDGEGTSSGVKKPPLPAIRRRPPVARGRCSGRGRGGRGRMAPVKATIGLDGVMDDGGAVCSDDNVDGGEVASDDDIVL